MNRRGNLRSINTPPSTWCRSVDPILVKIQLLWLLDFRLGFVFVIFVLFLDYIWFKLSYSLWLLGSLECLLRHWQCVSQCFLADRHSTLDGWYFFNLQFQYIARWKDKENKIIFPATSLVVIHHDTTWKNVRWLSKEPRHYILCHFLRSTTCFQVEENYKMFVCFERQAQWRKFWTQRE